MLKTVCEEGSVSNLYSWRNISISQCYKGQVLAVEKGQNQPEFSKNSQNKNYHQWLIHTVAERLKIRTFLISRKHFKSFFAIHHEKSSGEIPIFTQNWKGKLLTFPVQQSLCNRKKVHYQVLIFWLICEMTEAKNKRNAKTHLGKRLGFS